MESNTDTDMVDPQGYWLDHIQRCGEQHLSLSEYAKTNDIKVTRLYYWNKRLKRLGLLPGNPSTVSFTVAQISRPASTPLTCRLRFPNGAIVEWDTPLEGDSLEQLLSLVHHLP